MISFLRKLKSQKSNQRGAALLMAMFCVMIMTFLAVELSFDTSVEYLLSNKEYHRVKAYEAAKAGVELSLLRIQLFKNVTKQYGQQLKGQESILEMIWSLPFTWPPSIPDGASIVDKDQIGTTISESFMEARYVAQISAEGSKIDINDLDSPSEGLRNATRDQLIKLFRQKMDNRDDPWAEANRDFDYEELINNLKDWIDEDTISDNGGDEQSRYPEARTNSEATIPPNRPFQTMDELKMVDGMREDVFQFLLPHITVYGSKGINVNQANSEVLKSIDPIITDEIATEIITRRNDTEKGGPFRDENDFMSFIGANSQSFNPSGIPLFFGNEYNFRIEVTGEFQNVTRKIIAIVYDVEAVRDQMIQILDKEDQQNQGGQGNNGNQGSQGNQGNPGNTGGQGGQGNNQNQGNQGNNNSNTPSQAKPRVIYWWEN
jgi:general secretion pathway protein K